MVRPVRLAGLMCLAIAGASAASAQDPSAIITQLVQGARCSAATATDDIKFNIKKVQASPADIGAALNTVAADEARCAPLRDAAKALGASYAPAPPPPNPEEQTSTSASAVVAQTLAQAEVNASQLKFEVGPPPRNMTRGRDTAR